MKKSVAVLGLGQFGMSLAEKMYKMGADVLAVDRNEEVVQKVARNCTAAVCANLENEPEVLALGLKSMDIVVSTIGNNLVAAIMIVMIIANVFVIMLRLSLITSK